MIDLRPWSEDLEHPALRMMWIFAALLLLPSLALALGVSRSFIPLVGTLCALPACVGKNTELGIKPLELKDFFIVIGAYCLIILFSAIITPGWQKILDGMQIPYSEKQDEIIDLLGKGNLQDRLILFMSVCVITPVVEEVLFRRIIYSYLVKVNQFAGIFGTSLLFSIAHFFVFGIPALLIMGLMFQLIYLCRKNLSAAMLLHGLVNTMVFLMNFCNAEI